MNCLNVFLNIVSEMPGLGVVADITFFREINTFLKNFVKLTFSAKKLVLYSTVCKSTIKCDDAQNFP